MQNFITITTSELETISGGAKSAWDSYVASQRTAIAPAYKSVVCTTAGIKGGPQLATQVYGADRTTGADMIRAAETVRGVCQGGAQLPSAAPASPF